MKLLSFLGLIDRYQDVVYTFKDKTCQTMFSTIAACEFLDIDDVVIFLTPETKQRTYPVFIEKMPPAIPVQAVDIPLGENESQLWALFSAITAQVNPGEQVAFDITNGLRLFPLLGVLAAAFINAARSVSVRSVLYGAYEVGRLHGEGTVPMFDLSPMISLFDWTLAAERFTQFGDSEQLADLLETQKSIIAKNSPDNAQRLQELSAIGRLANTMQAVSQALDLIRPTEIFTASQQLRFNLDQARPVLETTPKTQPFVLLLDQIQHSYDPLSGFDDQPAAMLEKQYRLVTWYLQHKYWMHTVTLARELMVNWFLYQSGVEDWLDKAEREKIEKQINHDASELRFSKKHGRPFSSTGFGEIPTIEAVLDTWNRLTQIRNDIDHAGHRNNPISAERLMRNISAVVGQIGEVLF